MTSPKDLLVHARALIENPANWTRRSFARDSKGAQTPYEGPAACRFCAKGALYRAAFDLGTNYGKATGDAHSALFHAADSRGLAVTEVNDEQGHAAVLEMFDQAIDRVGGAS